ncbi:MAG TPA: histone deacetylase [Candidatus Babeliales bacterium]|nr:histone deacetylase [Candidatus Babeliales bacterium]
MIRNSYITKPLFTLLFIAIGSNHYQAQAMDLNPLNWDFKTKCAAIVGTAIVAKKGWDAAWQLKDRWHYDGTKIPLVYHENYDIGFFGIEKLHPFDSHKYSKVAHILKTKWKISDLHFYQPASQVSQEDLLKVHTEKYLNSLSSSKVIQQIVEVPVAKIPNFLLQHYLLSPMRYGTQGTVMAAQLAFDHGAAINLSGGYHHAKQDNGSGFCVYADIPLAIQKLREKEKKDLKIFYIDLDAHQGDGVESCLKNDPNVYFFDCYNEKNFPYASDSIELREKIHKKLTSKDIYCQGVQHSGKCQNCNHAYIASVKKALPEALDEFQKIHKAKPDLIFYNAGTDPFEEDALGRMKLTKKGIIDRDEFVFAQAIEHEVPICMTLSGGYSLRSAEIISASIWNLWNKGYLKKIDKERVVKLD